MDSKLEKQMAIMVNAVQPYCQEQIVAAMTCSHAGSMNSLVMSKLLGGAGAGGAPEAGGAGEGSRSPPGRTGEPP